MKDKEYKEIKESLSKIKRLMTSLDDSVELIYENSYQQDRLYKIIAENLLLWRAYKGSCNDEQDIYAPNQETASSLSAGQSIYKFVEEAIEKEGKS